MNKSQHEIDENFMRRALVQAAAAFEADEVPVGAVMVYGGRIIAQAYNQVETLKDPTAHAEILAITQAAAFLQSKWLEGATLYVTIEPCSMCAGALVLSRIARVVFGARDLKTGAFGSKVDINRLQLNHKIKVTRGVLGNDCSDIISQFFKHKRKKK
jgi:tRNA(adenine34) deaminase